MRRTYLQIQRLKVPCISFPASVQQDCEPVSPLWLVRLAALGAARGVLAPVPVMLAMQAAGPS